MKPFRFGIGLIALAIVFTPAIASPVIFTVDTTIESTNNSYDGQDIIVSNAVLTVDGPHSFASLRLAGGAMLTHSADSGGLNLDVSENLEVENAASINANGRGFSLGQGTGLGGTAGGPPSGGGGGHGGYGGVSSTNATGGASYGSAFAPGIPGGCGGTGLGGFGGAGGGVVRLTVGSNFVVNGAVTVNGLSATNSRSGGGAGGSLWVTAQTLSGNGVITANGGAGEPIHGGGGGGGRIALEIATNLFTGTIAAMGGNGWQRGGAGTVFLQTDGARGLVVVDNGSFAGASTPLISSSASDALEVRGRATVVTTSSASQYLGGLVVRSNSMLTTLFTNNAMLYLSVLGDAVIEPGATISVLGKGATSGPGMGMGSVVAGGSGHGGVGGTGYTGTAAGSGGLPYDSIMGPLTPGVAGRAIGNFPGGAGGGAVRLTVNGNLQLDGRIIADATAASGTASGGASGGSVSLVVGGFAGSGAISANGSNGGVPYGGGGAGGRIAVTYSSNSFHGTMSAAGGNGARAGGAGTIYTRLNSASFADVRVDNGGLIGTNTPVSLSGSYNLTVLGGAVVDPVSSQTLGNLTIGSNSTFLVWPYSSGSLNLTVSSNVIVEAGGSIFGDGLGNTGGTGPGAGLASAAGSTGGGHGGYGGRGAGHTNTPSSGGNSYDSTTSPAAPGSGGGGTLGAGGAGGAALRLTVSGNLVVDGRISANGLGPITNNAGGGSGGSLWLSLNRFSGSGTISADGGAGHLPNGGGGGGGRIAITWNSNSFTGTYSAKGGNGFVAGGAGTVYLRSNGQFPNPQLLVDNGGLMGTNTVLDVTQLASLHIGPGANLTSSAVSFTIGDLTIASNATWRAGALNLIASSVSIAAGGGLIADGSSITGQGQGQPSNLGSSGAGHGGYGGCGAGTSGGGNVYGTIANPTSSGSQGGFLGVTGGAARGGGALRITVSGPTVLDGRISANGDNCVTNNGGGGSGGSVLLALNQFSGSGDISANGGSGHLPNGGGGGGGRIALTWNSNAFTGNYSAKGGNGFQGGGAGTIYLKANNSQLPSVIADNGGLIGTNTMLEIGGIANLTITGGANVRPTITTLSVGNLTITTNSALLAASANTSSGSTLNLEILSAANIAAGGRISADGLGLAGGGIFGGAGQSGTPGSGGGGHGGYGGRGLGVSAGGGTPPGAGGNAYDSLLSPISPGSGGGGIRPDGGAGGGVLRITASRSSFILNGIISANGDNTSTNGRGGGAGGSVWLTFDELIGNGNITADGGSGHLPNGGGGGGGRISVSYNFLKGNFPTNGFTGAMSAKGGAGYVKGGAGTIYVRTNNSAIANVFVDNGGTRGTNTLVTSTTAPGFDLYVQGGAVVSSPGNPRDLFVSSNSWVQASLTVSRNATFDAGGGIDVNGLSSSGPGGGSTSSNPKGGGGHGGRGALNPPGAGAAYGSVTSPVQSGSAGGNGSGNEAGPLGGQGGGFTHLTVGSMLTLNGEISADGRNGELNSGGGSGGSVWIQAMTLAGNGSITATGGNGNGPAGGGGGGRIAIYFTTNQFTGLLSACGGAGGAFGGAGTIYLRDNPQVVSSLILDNCGNWGANTPLSPSIGLANNLTVTGSAVAEMQGAIPILSNVVVSAGGEITSGSNDTNLFLALLGNLTVTEDAGIITDAKGFARDSGPGYGGTFSNQGAGGSYGGWGGDSASGAWSGPIYGSATMPAERGSGGGSGSGYPAAGSEGGGAIRLTVAGTIEMNGLISASGGMGWQDDAGGGSGGSVWISTRKFTGDGIVAAVGGDGDFFGGGGGGGGRIAIYSPTNTFSGFISAVGGDGANFGWAGTIFTSGSLSGLEVVGQTPTGIVSNVVSQVALEFSEPVNLASVSPGDVRIFTPYGLLPGTNQTYLSLTPTMLLVNFNPQNVLGNYRVEVGPLIEGLLAPRMSQVHTGAFSIALPTIAGTVTNLNGQGVAGVSLHLTGGLTGGTTDVNGNYSLGVPPGWDGAVTPVLGTNAFVPGRLSYTNIYTAITAQNYLMVATMAPTLSVSRGEASLTLNWSAIPGVTYQPEFSTNLVSWLPYGPPLPATNGWMQLVVPNSSDPRKFVRLRATN